MSQESEHTDPVISVVQFRETIINWLRAVRDVLESMNTNNLIISHLTKPCCEAINTEEENGQMARLIHQLQKCHIDIDRFHMKCFNSVSQQKE